VRRTFAVQLWLAPCVLIPGAVAIADQDRAAALLEWLLSFDMPMALLLSAQVGSAIATLAARVDPDAWIAPAASRGAAGKFLKLLRLLGAVRWPAGLAIAALLLSARTRWSTESFHELLLIAGFAMVGGASLAWMLLARPRAKAGYSRRAASRNSGWSSLSWAPLHETRQQLNLRRLMLLAVPVMLAAPMATAAQEVLRGIAAWIVLFHVAVCLRQAARISTAMRLWIPRPRISLLQLHWYTWRYALLAALCGLAMLWLGWRVTSPRGGGATP